MADLERAAETARRLLIEITAYEHVRQSESSARLMASVRGVIADIEVEKEQLKLGCEQ